MTLFRIALLLALNINALGQGELIRYKTGSSLDWDDFKRNVDSTSSFSAYGLSYLGYNLQPYADGYILSLDAFFSPDSSWVRHKTEHGLEHENYHFKLTEIVRRRMLKELYNIQFEITEIHEIIDNRLDNYALLHDQDQDYYDIETDYGRNRKRQREIESKIDSLLLELNAYRFQYIVFCTENNVSIKKRILTNDISSFMDDP